MAGPTRAFFFNLLYEDPAGTFLSATSADPDLPVSNLMDPLLSKVWRSASGWTVVVGFNDAIDFSENGTPRAATIAPGNYPTHLAFAAGVEAAINAAAVDNTYTVTGGASSFGISRATGTATVSFLWNTGANALTSAAYDLGFDPSADSTGGTVYNSAFNVYQGQHAVTLILSETDAANPGEVALVLNHNLMPSTGSFTLSVVQFQGNVAGVFPPAGSITHEIQLEGTGTGDAEADMRAAILEEGFTNTPWTNCRGYRWIFRNMSQPEGFTEAGIVWVGPIASPSIRPSINLRETREELSEIVQAIDGATHTDERPMRRVLDLEFLELPDDDVAVLERIADENPRGRCFFWNWDDDDLFDTWYGYMTTGLIKDTVPAAYMTVTTQFAEALG